MSSLRIFRLYLVLFLLTGLIYPLITTGVAQLWRRRAVGSLIVAEGRVVGSELIAQSFTSDKYFWPRPSATNHNPLPSGGSNLGPTSQLLRDQVEARAEVFAVDPSHVPADLLFASGSGLDPHLSLEAALFQVERVAKARGFEREALEQLVREHVERPSIDLIGKTRINVLLLNQALDARGQKNG